MLFRSWKVVICLVEGLGRGRRASEDQFGEERSGRVDGLVRLREALIWYFLNGVDCRRTLLTRRHMKEFEKSVIDMQMRKYLLAAEIQCRCCSSSFAQTVGGEGCSRNKDMYVGREMRSKKRSYDTNGFLCHY